jgi:hypothetical protein
MTGALALGIDLGTSGVRTALVDATGAVVASARADYATHGAWREPEGWWNAVTACLDAQLESLREYRLDPGRITRIGVDGTSGSLVLTDAALNPVGPALMYSDGGLDREAAMIAAHAPARHITHGPASALARALRLAAEDRDRRARHLLHQADFILARLTGRGGRTDVNNALKTGIDPETGRWPDWMQSLPLPQALLPKAHMPGARVAPISPATAARFGLPVTAHVHAGTTDSIAAFLAAARPVLGSAVTSLGSTLALKLYSDVRIDAPEIGLYAHRLGNGWLLGGASNTGGAVLLQHFSRGEIEALSARIDPSLESPLDYYPLPGPGERFPVNDPQLQPRLTPRPADDADFLHGLLEGIARIEAEGYALLQQLGAPRPARIITAGGGAASPVWTAIRARVLGRPVEAAATGEAAVGTARLVAAAP